MTRRDVFKHLMQFLGVSVVASAIPQTQEADEDYSLFDADSYAWDFGSGKPNGVFEGLDTVITTASTRGSGVVYIRAFHFEENNIYV